MNEKYIKFIDRKDEKFIDCCEHCGTIENWDGPVELNFHKGSNLFLCDECTTNCKPGEHDGLRTDDSDHFKMKKILSLLRSI